MTATVADLRSIPPIDRAEAVTLGRVEYQRFVDVLRSLDVADWDRPTDCEGWTVRDLAGHLAGSMGTVSSLTGIVREQVAVARRSKRTGEAPVDAMTALQVERMRDLPTDALVRTMSGLVDRAAGGRGRVPGVVANGVRFKVEVPGVSETWRLDYLLGPILTRDTWLHRVADLARAIGRPPALDAEHDGRIVADVAREWAVRHGQPVQLTLTGPAGGRFVAGAGDGAGEELELDAVEFCRIMTGRADPTHRLLETKVPF